MLDEKPRNQSMDFSNGAHQRNTAVCGRMCGNVVVVVQLFAVVFVSCNCCIATIKAPWVSVDDPRHIGYLHTSPFSHINCNGLSQ